MKIRIELDEAYTWRINTEDDLLELRRLFLPDMFELDASAGVDVNAEWARERVTPSFEISDEFFERYKRVQREYFDLQEQLESLYRLQHGMEPYPSSAVPEYRKL